MMRRTLCILIVLIAMTGTPFIHAQSTDGDDYARALELTLHAQSVQATAPDEAALLAIRALRTAYVPQAAEILSAVMPQLPARLLPGDWLSLRDLHFIDDRLLLRDENGVSLLDAATGEAVYQITPPLRDDGEPLRIAAMNLSPDETRIVVAYFDYTAHLYDAATGELVRVVDLPRPLADQIHLTPNHEALLINDGRYVRLYDMATETITFETESPRRGSSSRVISTAVMSPDGTLIATDGGTDNAIQLWGAGTGELIAELSGHGDFVMSLDFHPDGTRLVSGGADNTARVWDLETLETEYVIARENNRVSHVQFTPDGEQTLIGTSYALRRYDRWRLVQEYVLYSGRGAFAINDTMDTLVMDVFRSLGVFPLAALEERVIPLDGGFVEAFQAVPGSDDFVISTITSTGMRQFDYNLRRIDGTTGSRLWEQPVDGAYLAVPSPDARFIVTGYFTGNPDAGDRAFALVLHDAATGEVLRQFDGHEDRVQDAAFSPDGATLYSIANDAVNSGTGGTLRAWDVATGEQIHLEAIRSAADIALNPDGSVLAVASLGVTFYDTNTWEVLPLSITTGGLGLGEVSHVTFSVDGRFVLTVHDDGAIRLSDATTGAVRHAWYGHTGIIFDIAFSPDSRYAASVARDGRLIVWDTATGVEVVRYIADTFYPEYVAFTADNNNVVSLGRDGAIHTWPLTMATVLDRACERLTGIPDYDLDARDRAFYGIDQSATCTE